MAAEQADRQNTASHPQIDRIAEQHSDIRARLRRLQELTSPVELRAELTALRETLLEHFAEEEDLMQVHDLNRASNICGLAKVLEEHPMLVAQLDTLISDCAAPALDEELRAKLAEFATMAQGHEEREGAALMDAVWTDVGGY